MESNYNQIDEIESKEIEQQEIELKGNELVDNEFKESAPSKKKKIVYLLIIFFMGIAFIYSFFSLYFMNHFYFNTYIDKYDFQLSSIAETEEIIQRQIQNYSIKVEGRNGLEDTILGSEIGVEYIADDSLNKIMKSQKPFFWIASIFKTNDYEIEHLIKLDEELLQKKQSELIFNLDENIVVPENAYISSYNPDVNGYQIISENNGSQLIQSRTYDVLKDAVSELNDSVSLEKMGCYLVPDIKSDDKRLVNALQQMNQYVKSEITYDFGTAAETLNGNIISTWINYNGDEVVINSDKVKEYIKTLSKKYNTYGKNREFKTTSGNLIVLPSGGYGWLIDQDTEYLELMENLKDGLKEKREPAYSVRGFTRGTDDIGDTYVEVDLGKQHLYVYRAGKIIEESDFVSGNMVKGFATPPGVFGITYKARNAVLRGEDYETPVNYWMPFNGNIGLHDAVWRHKFGGDIYVNSGSHGCLNLPKQKATQIYDMVEQGMPVICYY